LEHKTDMGFWDKSLRIFKSLCDNGTQGVRRIAQQTGLSKSSVHRLKQAMERRNSYPESWFWETADGRQWLTRLVVAYLLAADNVSGPLPISLREVKEPVIITRNRFSRPRPRLLTCM